MISHDVDYRETLEGFIDEARDSLRDLPDCLDAFARASTDRDSINAVFRAIHSIKGCAAFLDLGAIRAFSHSLENTLDEVRNDAVSLTEKLQRQMVTAFDHLDDMLQRATSGDIAEELIAQDEALLQAVCAAAQDSPAVKSSEQVFFDRLLEVAEGITTAEPTLASDWGRRLQDLVCSYAKAGPGGEKRSADAATPTPADLLQSQFFHQAEDITRHVHPLLEAFVGLRLDGESPGAERSFLDRTQQMISWANQAKQTKLEESLYAAVADFRTIVDSALEFDENLRGIIWEYLVTGLLEYRVSGNGEAKQERADDDTAEETTTRAPSAKAPATDRSRFVRVKEDRIEEFLEHVSRLFIMTERFRDIQGRMAQSHHQTELVEELRQVSLELKAESTSLQRGVMALRQISVAGLFSKFPRMARDLANQLGKQVKVHVAGEDAEIDKRLSEDLDAPLTHLIRNVMDHGLETPEQRQAIGKPDTGNLWLEAKQIRNHIHVLVRDDGRGIDPQKIRQKAVEKGVIAEADARRLSDEKVLNLIFQPGFSTAEQLSEVSGRGVGMDVVRTTVEEHGGRIEIESAVGQGTTITLDIPVRQATLVIDGLMIAQDEEQFVIPFENIREIAAIEGEQLSYVHGQPVISIRNKTYAALSLDEAIGHPIADGQTATANSGIVLHSKNGEFCLMVNRVIGHRQVVVTSLKEVMTTTQRVCGVAQLGGGALALVIDVGEIAESLRGSEQAVPVG